MMPPQITVLMSVFNAEKYLAEAIESILKQTFKEFIFLIIDDASTDQSLKILESYSDLRIQIIRNKKNLGLAASLNLGLAQISTPYIARMDADDVALPNRLKIQYQWMEKHPDIGICGAFMKEIGTKKYWTPHTDPEKVHAELIFNSSLNHPTVMMRTALLQKYQLSYDPSLKTGQDYLLWVQCAEHFKLGNIPRVLLKYRVHPQQAGITKKSSQENTAREIRNLLFKQLHLEPSASEIEVHEALGSKKKGSTISEKNAEKWIKKILENNAFYKVFPQKTLQELFIQRKKALFQKNIFSFLYNKA